MKYELELKKLVARQAEDDGIWFIAQTAAEAYLQSQIRKLHALIEGNDFDIAIFFNAASQQEGEK